MKQEQLKSLANELAKDVKSEKALSALTSELVKLTVETALGAEMEQHLGYAKHSSPGSSSGNSRNGYSSKTLKGDHGEVQIGVARDRDSEFEPVIVGKRQTRLTQFDDQILSLYAKGMSTRDIVSVLEQMYGAKVASYTKSVGSLQIFNRITGGTFVLAGVFLLTLERPK